MKRRNELDKNRDEIVQALLDTYSVTETGIEFKDMRHLFSHLHNKTLLSYWLMKKDGFEQKFDEARYWFSFSNNPMTDDSLNSIIPDLKSNSDNFYENGKILLQNQLLEIKKQPLQNFDLFFVLDVRPISDFQPFSVTLDGMTVEFQIITPLKEPLSIPSFAGQMNFLKDRSDVTIDYKNTLCLHLAIAARNHHYARKEGIQKARFILGWIGFLNNVNSGVTYSFNFPHAFEKCPSFVFLLIGNEQKECHRELIWKCDGIQDGCPIPKNAFQNICTVYSKGTEEAKRIVFAAMNAYYTGLHEDNMEYALLAFWAALEQLCLKKDEGLSHIKMLNRLSNLIPHSSNINEFELTMLLALRNDMVHNWKYEVIGQYERYLMKIYADFFINYFVTHLMTLNQAEIELFYSKFNCPNKELEEHETSDKKVFDLIRKQREKPRSTKVSS